MISKYRRKISVTVIMTFCALVLFVVQGVKHNHVFGESPDHYVPGLVIMGENIKGGVGFNDNIFVFTSQELEAMKDGRNPAEYGLGDSWVENVRFSSYDNHGSPNYSSSIADGIDLSKMFEELLEGGMNDVQYVMIQAADGNSFTMNKSLFSGLKYFYFNEETNQTESVESHPPIIAFYKTTGKPSAHELKYVVVPAGPAERLPKGGETLMFGQTEPEDHNHCSYVKYVNGITINNFNSFVKSDSNKNAIASLKNILEWGIYEKEYEFDKMGVAETHKVKGIPLAVLLEKMKLSRYMPDYGKYKVEGISGTGEKITLNQDEIPKSTVVWDDDKPVTTSGYISLYSKDKNGAGLALNDLRKVNIVNVYDELISDIPPEKPENFKVKSGSYSTNLLSWKKVDNASGYKVFRADDPEGEYKSIGETSTETYRDRRLTTGKKYYYKVRAYVKNKNGAYTFGEYSSAAGAAPVLLPPNVRLTAGKNRITLSFRKIKGADAYIVYRATKKKGSYKTVKTIASKSGMLKYTDKKLKKGKLYYYKIKAYRIVEGKKVYSAYSTVKAGRVK